MKIHGVKREWTKPLWVRLKKHYCPNCMEVLVTTKVSRVVDPKSDDGKNHDFSSGDTHMMGNTKFIWTEFQCTSCGNRYSLQEIDASEKKRR